MAGQQEFLTIAQEGQGTVVRLSGDWVIDHSRAIIADLDRQDGAKGAIDASAVGRMDLWGSLRIRELIERSGAPARLNDNQKKIYDFLPAEMRSEVAEDRPSALRRAFEDFGRTVDGAASTIYGVMSLIGEIAVCFARNLRRPAGFRFHSVVRHIEETGLKAIPIIGLLAILISMVISYQAATQLQKFGANIFTIDLTVISLLREMGVLVTAIMVAGRSGSAFAAEIGVMKLREEVDALRTMGMDPIEVLVLPRVIAMMITLPILAFLANIVGLAGGAVISVLLLDIPFDMYIDRVQQVAKLTMFFVGMIKAPVFAFIITIIGTYQGMNVTGSAESVGQLTTKSVVQSIFVVIMVDALFSILFANLGI